jgi:hypothetical protein
MIYIANVLYKGQTVCKTMGKTEEDTIKKAEKLMLALNDADNCNDYSFEVDE